MKKNQGEELFNKKQGIEIKGELLIPKERKRIEVELTPPLENELRAAFKEIIRKDMPPEPQKNKVVQKLCL